MVKPTDEEMTCPPWMGPAVPQLATGENGRQREREGNLRKAFIGVFERRKGEGKGANQVKIG